MPATAHRVLNQRELNRALLARQRLLERKSVSLPRALERLAGIQAQYAPSMYVGLWSRVEGFEREDLTRALEQRRAVTPEEGLALLVRRYLAAFGPAARGDIADWTGISAKEIASALKRLKLRRFSTEGGEELLDLPRAALPDPDTPAPARFLPVWDATLLVHARRTGILPEEYRPRVFNTRTPHSMATFTVDGVVAGSWRHEGGRVRLEPFRPLDRATRQELKEEAERLTELHR